MNITSKGLLSNKAIALILKIPYGRFCAIL